MDAKSELPFRLVASLDQKCRGQETWRGSGCPSETFSTSLGTLVNGMEHVYRAILEAVGRFPETQVVLSVGKNIDPVDLRPIPSNVIIVSTAPQIELLKRASLCITHAGLNTALEALAQGVPMVAIPIGIDQPGVAARIAFHGVGEFVEIGDLTAERLAQLIQRVRQNPSYRDKARYRQKVIARTHGLDVAADAIERAFNGTDKIVRGSSTDLSMSSNLAPQ